MVKETLELLRESRAHLRTVDVREFAQSDAIEMLVLTPDASVAALTTAIEAIDLCGPYAVVTQRNPAAPDSWVYFAQRSSDGLIKIGTSCSVQLRLAQLKRELRTALNRSADVALLVTIPGGVPEESALHRQFADCRAVGEWFFPTEKLLAHIDELRACARVKGGG